MRLDVPMSGSQSKLDGEAAADDKEMEDEEEGGRREPLEGVPEIIGPDLVCIEALDPPPIQNDQRKRRVKKDT